MHYGEIEHRSIYGEASPKEAKELLRGRHRAASAAGAAGRAELSRSRNERRRPDIVAILGVLSAIFAALTAIFAKIGVENINSDFATFIRTVVILLCLGAFLVATDQLQSPGSISGKTYLFLVLSGLATGASWVCYFRALKIAARCRTGRADRDKLSVGALSTCSPSLFSVSGHRRSGWFGDCVDHRMVRC